MSERTQQRSVGEELQSVGAEFQASREQWERERVLLSALVQVSSFTIIFLACCTYQEKETELAELKTKVCVHHTIHVCIQS